MIIFVDKGYFVECWWGYVSFWCCVCCIFGFNSSVRKFCGLNYMVMIFGRCDVINKSYIVFSIVRCDVIVNSFRVLSIVGCYVIDEEMFGRWCCIFGNYLIGFCN